MLNPINVKLCLLPWNLLVCEILKYIYLIATLIVSRIVLLSMPIENCVFFLLPAAALLFPIWHGDSWAVVRWFIGSALDNLPASNNIKTSHTAKHQDISYEGEKYNMELNHNENIKQIKASSISDGESWNHCDQKSQGSKVTLCVLLTTMIWLPVSQK